MATEAASAWQDHKQQGNALYTAGKTAEAVDAYTKALQCDDLPPPDRATILCNRAQCFLKLNDNAKAAEDCTACLTLSPDNVKALFRRCAPARVSPTRSTAGSGGRGASADGAARACGSSLSIPRPCCLTPVPRACRAAALEALGDLADALRDYRDVARVSPSVADAGAGVRRLEAKLGIAPAAAAGADALPAQLEELLAGVDRSLAAVEASLAPFLDKPLKHVVTQLQPLDNARLNTSLAFCSASLLFCECPAAVEGGGGTGRGVGPFARAAGDEQPTQSTGL